MSDLVGKPEDRFWENRPISQSIFRGQYWKLLTHNENTNFLNSAGILRKERIPLLIFIIFVTIENIHLTKNNFFCYKYKSPQNSNWYKMSRIMKKPAFCLCENKDADQLHCNPAADQHLCFRSIDVQSLFFLNLKFQASYHLL